MVTKFCPKKKNVEKWFVKTSTIQRQCNRYKPFRDDLHFHDLGNIGCESLYLPPSSRINKTSFIMQKVFGAFLVKCGVFGTDVILGPISRSLSKRGACIPDNIRTQGSSRRVKWSHICHSSGFFILKDSLSLLLQWVTIFRISDLYVDQDSKPNLCEYIINSNL